MQSFRRGVVTMMAAGALVGVPLSNPRATRNVVRGAGDAAGIYSTNSKEFYLSADEIEYVRPGFNITVNSVTINADRKVVVDLSFKDDLGQPLDRKGQVTPGALSLSFILAWYDPGTRHYTAYTTRVQTSPITGVSATQAGSDTGGSWQDPEVGHGIYTFGKAFPEGYDTTKTTTVGIYATRNLIAVPEGNFSKNYFANVEYDFRPDGADVTDVWDKLSNQACNACHNPLSAHGGSRRDVKLCVLCHQPQTVDPDTGNTVDFKVMVHKIHRGEDLPSVQAGTPYVIIGFNQTPLNFSTVAFPQDIRNCDKCHAPASIPPDQLPTQAAVNITFPSRAACGSCHDDVNFDTGENHPGLAQADDSQCATCHHPQGDREWDASILGAHTVPFKSTQLKGVKADIVSVSNTAPGQHPTVLFTITQNDGTPIPPSAFTVVNANGTTSSGLNLIMSGPTTDYAVFPQLRERADGATASGSNYSYTFTHAIPADATGTWGFSIEARLIVTLNPAPRNGPPTVRDAAFNPIAYAPVTDSLAKERRQVVDIAKCNVCHDRLALHGSNRLNTQECVFCHNPNGNDAAERPEGEPFESIDFKRMIHRIHTGDRLCEGFDPCPPEQIYTIGEDNNFNEVRFPGDRRDCAKCHVNDSQQVVENPPEGLLPTNTPRDYYSPQQHFAAACLGCHNTKPASAHAYVMTAPFGEACAACHGEDADFSVNKVHAR